MIHNKVNMKCREYMRRGEIGCWLSHLAVQWKRFLNSNANYLLVFEDDATLTNNFKNV